MALNPFHSFRKFQKFWMAAILLLCMVTFVLCTGVSGDLSTLIIDKFRPRGGTVLVRIEGRKLYRDEFDRLKDQRNIANEFMKKAIELTIFRIDDFISKNEKNFKEADRKTVLPQLMGLKEDLTVRKLRQRYFDTGVKFDDLVDFLVWRTMADREGIKLVPESVVEMVRTELFAPQLERFGILADTSEIQYEIRRHHPNVNDKVIFNSLRDEYRVRIAQLALLQAQPTAYMKRGQGLEGIKIAFGTDPVVRAVPSPAQLWDYFKQQRSEFDVALMPILVDDFLLDKTMPRPTEGELESFFQKYRSKNYDPTSPEPAFGIPHRIKVAWIMGDPQAPLYQNAAKIVRQLEVTPPLAYHPWQPAWLTATAYLARQPAAKDSLAIHYDHRKRDRRRGFEYLTSPITAADFLTALVEKVEMDKPTLAGLASLVGALSRPDAIVAAPMTFRWNAYVGHQKELAPVLASLSKTRSPAYATPIFSGAAGSAITPWAQWYFLSNVPQFLPLELVQKEFEELGVNQLAQEWINKNMLVARSRLENKRLSGEPFIFSQMANNCVEEFALRRGSTGQSYDRYTIDQARELEPLRDVFRKYVEQVNIFEGRAGTDKKLKDDDFHKLFFDQNEKFSLASTQNKLFEVQAWPPKVMVKDEMARIRDPQAPPRIINLFEEAEKPILFWKIEDETADTPKDLKMVRKEVELAWKIDKARGDKFALGKAREIAEALQKAGGNFDGVLEKAAKEFKRDVVDLRQVAPLWPRDFESARDYEDYPLPKDKFLYPREDMVKDLLTLVDLKEPLKSGNKVLDDINQKLFDVNKKLGFGRQIQILTNKPQAAFYVAVVKNDPYASRIEFDFVYRRAVGHPIDTLATRGQIHHAKEYRQLLVRQLREDLKVKIEEGEVKGFDTDTGN